MGGAKSGCGLVAAWSPLCRRLVAAAIMLALCVEPIIAFGGFGKFLSSSDDLDQVKRNNLQFAVRTIELGMDLDKQAAIDKKAFDLRNMPSCATINKYCPVPKLPTSKCEHGYNPVIKDLDEAKCSCVTEYACCPKTCPKLTDADWKHCDNAKKYGIGKYYPYQTEDCCDCPTIICMPCIEIILDKPGQGVELKNDTHRYFSCQNDCDSPKKIADPITKCWDYKCERNPREDYPVPKCDSKCHENETKTDKCGYDFEVCKCRTPPQCTPKRPDEIACHSIEKVNLEVYACDPKDESKCIQCYQWRYIIKPVKHINKTCKACEMEKVRDLGCGSFETICPCRKPINCHPKKPAPPPCHKVVKVTNQDSSMCDRTKGIHQCEPCFHWNFVPEKYTVAEVTCDENCEYKRPVSEECGSAQECVCIGKSKKHCQPDKPTVPKCFSVEPLPVNGSYMCSEDSALDKCAQCFVWDFTKDKCPTQDPVQCNTKCQTAGREHTGCDCYKDICHSTVIPQCQPAKPILDPDCYKEPRQQYREGVYSYDAASNTCIQCYRWIEERKDVKDKDECSAEMRALPNKCVSDYTTQGKCNSLVTQCRRNHLSCTERYVGSVEDVCPKGQTMVTLNTSCGDGRDACVDCDKVVEKMWMNLYPKWCYEEEKMIVMDKCEIFVQKKKECSFDQLIATPCPVVGMERKIFIDECNCPSLKCTGCPTTKHVDLQLILDSSNTIKETPWLDIINFLKRDFIPSIFTVKDSRLAVSRYGTTVEILRTLTPNVEAKLFDVDTYGYKPMGYTHTAEAMKDSFKSFDELARWNDENVIKAMIVITDGAANDPELYVHDAAKLWKDKGVKIYAIGLGDDIQIEELKKISDTYAVEVTNLEKLKKEIKDYLIPNICEQPYSVTN